MYHRFCIKVNQLFCIIAFVYIVFSIFLLTLRCTNTSINMKTLFIQPAAASFFGAFDFQQFLSAFIVLFAVIDIIGSIPIILDLKQKGRPVNSMKATLIAFALLLGFFYAGDMMLRLFQVDIASFAVAGAFVIFMMSLEMILDVEIFKNTGPIKEATSRGLHHIAVAPCRVCPYKHCSGIDS